MNFKINFSLVLTLITISCYSQRPSAKENGKFFELYGNKALYGGQLENQHFIINNLDLKEEQFHYGIGRERFPALLNPEFENVELADKKWNDEHRFLVAHKGNDIKAYSVKDLTRHEIVNDSLDGEPIMAAYCILADLGAIYKRKYDSTTLTFALSGYTYYDKDIWNGLDGFILWDRDTESLWWPLIGQAVSGPLKGVKLLEMDKSFWEDTTWKQIKEKYPKALVLISGQDFERPKSWQKVDNLDHIIKKYSD